MIHYSLQCETNHKFDGWFASATAFDGQHARGLVTCPVCGSSTVSKALMAPAVSRSIPAPAIAKSAAPATTAHVASGHPTQAELRDALRALRRKVMSEADYVGDRFAEEARKIHFEEEEPRGIYGEATRDEVVGLLEDGVDILPLPHLPEEHN